MEEGINLNLSKSLIDFDELLGLSVQAISTKKFSLREESEGEICQFQVGKYIQIENADDESALFWIGYGWNENDNHYSSLWIEFDAETCSDLWWDKINKLIGTSGKYYSEADFEFSKVYMNAWLHIYLKVEYLNQFYDEETDWKMQKEILTGFINEVLEKL